MYPGKRDRKERVKRRITLGCMVVLIGTAFLCVLFCSVSGHSDGNGESEKQKIIVWMEEKIERTYLPVFAFVESETGIHKKPDRLIEEWMFSAIPVFKYSAGRENGHTSTEDEETYELLIRREGSDEERKAVEEGSLEYEDDAMHIDGDLQNAMLKENNRHNGETQITEETEGIREKEGMTGEDALPEKDFKKAEEKSYEYNWDEVRAYEDIVSAFYAIDKTTSITDEQLNLENLLGRDMGITENVEGPQILIYHTHSQEGFVDSVEGDASTTIVGAGERLAQILREKYGFKVLHHTGEYDVEARDYAYSNSLPAIEQLLAENPTIEVVIDLHRDAVPEGRKLVVDLQGRPTAQFMFFNGLSRTRETGDIDYLENPYVNDNLAFSFQAQVACNEYYPGLARRIYLKAYRYNMHLRAKSMLVELGAQTNTVEEIMNACDPLAHVIAKVLSGETGDTAKAAAGIDGE